MKLFKKRRRARQEAKMLALQKDIEISKRNQSIIQNAEKLQEIRRKQIEELKSSLTKP